MGSAVVALWQVHSGMHSFPQGSCYGVQITVVTPANRTKVADQCVRWIDKPTILYAGPEWDSTHIYHFFLDNFVPFFATAIQTNIFDPEPFWHRYAGH